MDTSSDEIQSLTIQKIDKIRTKFHLYQNIKDMQFWMPLIWIRSIQYTQIGTFYLDCITDTGRCLVEKLKDPFQG